MEMLFSAALIAQVWKTFSDTCATKTAWMKSGVQTEKSIPAETQTPSFVQKKNSFKNGNCESAFSWSPAQFLPEHEEGARRWQTHEVTEAASTVKFSEMLCHSCFAQGSFVSGNEPHLVLLVGIPSLTPPFSLPDDFQYSCVGEELIWEKALEFLHRTSQMIRSVLVGAGLCFGPHGKQLL